MALRLAPNPYRTGSIARVALLPTTEGEALAVNVDAIYNRPNVIKRFNAGYTLSIQFWKFVSSLLLIGGIAASFIWAWWIFIPSIIVAVIVHRANQNSAGDFAIQAIRKDNSALDYLSDLKLVWKLDPAKTTRA